MTAGGTAAYRVLDPVARPAEARLIIWQLDDAGAFRQVADVSGEDSFDAVVRFPVRVVPAALVAGRR
jgi:hypothetical protein